ncbi:hypothetical protein BH11PSE2_BH11PSE2_16190 [soil metagenome]
MIRKHICAALAATAALTAPAIAHAAWTKTYAIEWNEPAMYYGAKTGITDPGTDCPKGTNPEQDWVKVLVDSGYTMEEAKWLRDPANPTRSAVNGQNQMAFRGKDRANVYVNPTSTPESGGFTGVTGTIAEGINLDGNAKTGFTSPTGEKGIDNEFYRTLGCWKTYRGPERKSSGSLTFNDSMREGGYTVVIVVSGKGKDPMNDGDVSVGFYNSPDKMVKDGAGNIARDYTFRIKPDAKLEAVFKAKSVKGRIISTTAMDEIWMRDPSYARELQLLKARVDLQIKADGSLRGYIGGYRPWLPVYKGWVAARGPVIESLTWVRLPDVYYALRRAADYSPTGPNGEKTHISFALRVEAVPAFVMTPDAALQVAQADSYKAIAPKIAPPEPRSPALGGVIDGIVVARGGQAVSQTAEQMRPPKPTAVSQN